MKSAGGVLNNKIPGSTYLMVLINHPRLKRTVEDGCCNPSQQPPKHQDVKVVKVLSKFKQSTLKPCMSELDLCTCVEWGGGGLKMKECQHQKGQWFQGVFDTIMATSRLSLTNLGDTCSSVQNSVENAVCSPSTRTNNTVFFYNDTTRTLFLYSVIVNSSSV